MGGTDKKLPVGPEGLQPWVITRNGLERGDVWHPYATVPSATGAEGDPLPVSFAAAVADDVLITCSNKGHLVAWDYTERRPRWYTNLGGNPAHAFTPDGKLMALIAGGQLVVLEVANGNPVGKLALGELGHLPWPALAFSPSAKRLFLSSADRVLILGMASGEWVQDTKIAGVSTHHGIGFPHEDFVLIDGRYLVHWESRLKLWDYSDVGTPVVTGGYTFVGKNGDGGGSLLAHPVDRQADTV